MKSSSSRPLQILGLSTLKWSVRVDWPKVLKSLKWSIQKILLSTWSRFHALTQLFQALPTHILYTSIGFDFDGNIKFPYGDDIQILSELNFLDKMRQINRDLKVLISFSDIDEIQERAFNAILSNSAARKNFSKNVVGFCKRANLDGIDLNFQVWEIEKKIFLRKILKISF